MHRWAGAALRVLVGFAVIGVDLAFAGCSGKEVGGSPLDASASNEVGTGQADSSPSDADSSTEIDASTTDAISDTGADGATGFDGAPDVGVAACDGQDLAARWATAATQPILPPYGLAGLDLHPTSTGNLTLMTAEEALCPGDDLGDAFGDGTRVMGWGPADELWLAYDPATTFAKYLIANAFETGSPGYSGTLTFQSPDAAHTYVVALGVQIEKDGALFSIDWNDPTSFAAEADELYRGILATFVPSAPAPPAGTNCVTSTACVKDTYGATGFISFKTPELAISVANINATQPAASTPVRIDVYAAL